MTEKNLLNHILLKIAPLTCRLFRNNTGLGWAGRLVSQKNKDDGKMVVIRSATPLRAGLIKGSSDLIGWTTVEITPEMVGQKVAVFTAIEAKTGKTKISPEQQKFIDVVIESGGIAGVAKSVEDAVKIIKGDE